MRSRAWCFTSFHTSEDMRNVVEENDFKYICWGEETCPKTERKHLQGYVVFNGAVTLRSAKRKLDDDSIHLEGRKGSEEQAVKYCRKDGVFEEYGERSKQGKRSDLDGVREALGAGGSMREIIDSGASYQAVRYAEKWLTYKEVVRAEPPKVYWYWGATGTGKTRAALAEATECYGVDSIWWAAGNLDWFDGYDAHRVAIWDDFRPEWKKLSWVLRALDRYPMRVPYKGGYRQWVPEVIYITCPKPPEECYLDCGEDTEQLIRRITVIKEF